MGLLVSHLSTITKHPSRSLYIYLLDFGWPEGKYEQLFKDHFQAMAKRASETGSLIIASHRGVHFANDVLSYYRVLDLDTEKVLPALLITKTPPSYFKETEGPRERLVPDIETDDLCRDNIVVVPLKTCCTTPEEFASLMESAFSDLSKGTQIPNFRVAEHDKYHDKPLRPSSMAVSAKRIGKSIVIEPNFFGIGVDLKKLLGWTT
jgi:hypothetical protein